MSKYRRGDTQSIGDIACRGDEHQDSVRARRNVRKNRRSQFRNFFDNFHKIYGGDFDKAYLKERVRRCGRQNLDLFAQGFNCVNLRRAPIEWSSFWQGTNYNDFPILPGLRPIGHFNFKADNGGLGAYRPIVVFDRLDGRDFRGLEYGIVESSGRMNFKARPINRTSDEDSLETSALDVVNFSFQNPKVFLESEIDFLGGYALRRSDYFAGSKRVIGAKAIDLLRRAVADYRR